MFNIKNIVNKITDRGRESNPNSPGRAPQEDEGLNSQRAEGFLCPKCMKALSSPSDLQSHYESLHGEESAADVQGALAVGFSSLHYEVGEKYKRVQDESNSVLESSIDVKEVTSITDISELQKILLDILENRAALQSEKDHLEQRAAQLAQLNVTLKAACDEGESNQIALKERLKVVEAQLAHRESIDDAAVLRQELVQVQRVMDELNREREHERDALRAELQQLQSDCSQEKMAEINEVLEKKESEISQLKSALGASEKRCLELSVKYEKEDTAESRMANDEIEVLKTQIASLKDNYDKEIKSLKCEISKVSKERDALKESLQEIQGKSEEYKVSSLQEIQDLQMRAESVTLLIEESQNQLLDAKEEINSLYKERDNLKTEMFQKSQLIAELERIKASSEGRIEELTNALTSSKEKISQLEIEHLELVEKIQVGEGATTAIQQLTQENSSLQAKLKEEINRSSKNREESLRAMQDTLKQLSESENSKQKVELTLKNEQSQLIRMNTKLESMSEKYKGLQEQLTQKEGAVEELKALNQGLKVTMAELEKKYRNAKEEVSQKTIEISALSGKNYELEQELSKLQEELLKLEGVNLQLRVSSDEDTKLVEELLVELNAANGSSRNLQGTVTDLQDSMEKKEKVWSCLKAEMDTLVGKNSALTDKLKTTENQLQIIGVQRASLETNLFEIQKSMAELENEKKDLEEEKAKEVSALKEIIKSKTESLEKREEAMKMLMEERLELDQQLETIKENHLAEVNTTNAKFQQLQTELIACTQSKTNLEKNLSDEMKKRSILEGKLETISATLETTIKENTEKQKSLQALFDEVTGEKLALEVQLEASQAEQQALLERCYASASETETLHRTVADLRRKLDESQAALHELGRENQTLQLDIDKLTGRKWAEDSEVNQCTLCNRDFTIIMRKHHCRNCGQIFCSECSSKTAPIASNKKPVRVCDSCFSELAPK